MVEQKSKSEAVRVVVRCRPLNSKERSEDRSTSLKIDQTTQQISLPGGSQTDASLSRLFTFDSVFGPECGQGDLFHSTAEPIVDAVLKGFNGTIFTYGQTGAGKTFTMEGDSISGPDRGIVPRCFEQIFDSIMHSENQEFLVRVSFLELYNEELRDLLARNVKGKLQLREKSSGDVYIKGLHTFVVNSIEDISRVLQVGKKSRTVGKTLMNEDSSRSHSIFTLTVEGMTPKSDKDAGHIHVGTLNLVDLAGSERQSKSGTTGDRFKEATNINLSLSALGNVISALSDGRDGHVPYRESKLTRLLQSSLGGNTKTVMIATVGPADYNLEETLSTLRYASRAKNIQNKPKINEDPKDAVLRDYQEQIARLKAQLEEAKSGKPAASILGELPSHGVQSIEEIVEQEVRRRLQEQALQQELQQPMAAVNSAAGPRADASAQPGTAEAHRTPASQDQTESRIELSRRLAVLEKKLLRGQSATPAGPSAQPEQDIASLESQLSNQTYEATLRQLEEAQSARETEERQLHDKVMALREELKFKEDLITKLVPAGYRAKMMASLKWDEGQRRWVQQAPGSCLDAVAARRKARPLLSGLAGSLLQSSPSEMNALLTDMQPEPETIEHHQANLQQTQAALDAIFRIAQDNMSSQQIAAHHGWKPAAQFSSQALQLA
ncbi:hypothetical protein WJX74_005048 [Apatococcus lobatus]|uniref:Kinesin-like protein n=1 Tax=Apatococcus lobatus TaxID=904363 RepID=A0AAW1QDR9_9CHLO